MVTDEIVRDLLRQSVQGLEREPSLVLADALLETDRPDLGEDLALILANRLPFPRDRRGQPFAHRNPRSDSERPIKVGFRRIHRRFAWSRYDEEEGRRGLHELNMIKTNWNASSSQERESEMAHAIDWLEEDGEIDDPFDSTLYERAAWLLDGVFDRGAQILAEEIIDEPPSRHNREAQLFKLVLAFDDLLPPNATDRVWRRLSTRAQQHATMAIRQAIIENGGEIHVPTPRTSRNRRPR